MNTELRDSYNCVIISERCWKIFELRNLRARAVYSFMTLHRCGVNNIMWLWLTVTLKSHHNPVPLNRSTSNLLLNTAV